MSMLDDSLLDDEGCDEGLEDDLEEEEGGEGGSNGSSSSNNNGGDNSSGGIGSSSLLGLSGLASAGKSSLLEQRKQQHQQQQRLPLEDFMRKIVFQINSTSGKEALVGFSKRNLTLFPFPSPDKVWSNLLLDFTKSFAEYQVPYNGFASNDFDLLLDILNIAMKNLESTVVSEQVFASRLLLNINELLNGTLIREKVMPVLKKVLDGLLLRLEKAGDEKGADDNKGERSSSQTAEQADDFSSTIPLRFNLCFVLAHFAQRLG